ncbi:MAG: glycoside hydrolase family 5 protein [Oscillospiraceae bacterium]|nr:glycoside hydrolase family 5 protein [Oscillospiraceae bacterium]
MQIVTKLAAVVSAISLLTTIPALNRTELSGIMSELSNPTVTQPEEPDSDALTAPVDTVKLCDEITIGWNLGNSLDAKGSGLNSETSWGNPKVTKELILEVKNAGFDAVRIPTTWFNHVDDNFNVDKAWLDRVQEVVDYAYDEGMYVILNAHHENWNDPYESTLTDVKKKIKKLWTQIAERFEGYGKRLIFEGMNEPRWKNTSNEWNGGNAEGRSVINKYNETFVQTVRATGGNNRYRALMIPTYGASASGLDGFTVPDDKSLIVSIHAYTPYNFALNANGTSKFDPTKTDWNNTGELTWLADTLYDRFISKGVGAIIGECGTINKDNLSDRLKWAEYFPKVFGEKGIPIFLWDNNAYGTGAETFGMLNRTTLKWTFPTYINKLVSTAKKYK